MVRARKIAKTPEVVTPTITTINDGFILSTTTVTTFAESLQTMIAEQAVEINNKVVSWVGDRHDCNVEVYRGVDKDTYLLTKNGKTVDKLVLEYAVSIPKI